MITFRLGEILLRHRISQNQFAKISNVRPNTINDIVNGDIKRIEVQTLEKILAVLAEWGYTIDDLIKFSEEK